MIHTITLNPAVDRILYLDKYTSGVTNRLTKTVDHLGGKGTHVSINLKVLGVESVAHGIVFGDTGKRVLELLSEAEINTHFILHKGRETRTNYLLVEDGGTCTILANHGVDLTDDEIEEFIDFISEEIEDGDILVFAGDASNCPDPYVYNKIMRAFADKHVKVVMDASGDTLKKCIEEKPFMIKPNQDELSYIVGRPLETKDDIKEAMKSLEDLGISVVAVSLGAEGSIVYHDGKYYEAQPYKVNVKNTIGCGDCYLSGLIYGASMGYPFEKALKIATAISAACAESELSVGFDLARAKELAGEDF